MSTDAVRKAIDEILAPYRARAELPRDSTGRQYFGFCGTKVYVPDDDSSEESPATKALRIFHQRLKK